MLICPAIVDSYYALLRQRSELAQAGQLSPVMARHYAEVVSDLLVMGIKAAASDSVCTMTLAGPGGRPEPMIQQPWEGWSNFPTWAAHAWFSRDADIATIADELVAGAGDASSGGVKLAEYMTEQTGATSQRGGTPDLLAAGLEMTNWEEIAWWFAPDHWADPIAAP